MALHIHLRSLLRSKVFLATAVALLGLGLGVNVILFNTVYALLWRPLHFPSPDRLVALCGKSASGDLAQSITGADAAILREQTGVVAATGMATSGRLVTLWKDNDSLDLSATAVNSGYFEALGLRPLAGRFFGAEEDQGSNSEQHIVLTEPAWRTYFASDRAVIGGVLPIQEGSRRRQARIIGIAPGSVTLPFASNAGLLLPIPWLGEGVRNNFGDALYSPVLRLRPGVRLAEASARLDSVLQSAQRSSHNWVWGTHWVEPLRSLLAPVDHRVILLVYASACLLLLLTCANLASLFIARATTRTHEISVHLALGATRGRLLRGAFQEALLVALAGAGLAFLAESWTRPLIPKLIPDLNRIGPELMSPSPMLMAFAAAICLLVSLVVSIASGLRIETAGLAAALASGGRGASPSAGRFRAALAAAQLAVVLTLLTVAGLAGRSFLSAVRTSPGLDPQGVLSFQAVLPGALRTSPAAIADLARDFAAAPGVRSVTFAAEPPVGHNIISTATAPRTGEIVNTDPMIAYRLIGPNYFETIGAHMAAGRSLTEDEVLQFRPVVVLNQAAARLLFHGENPVGRTVHSSFQDRRSVVVGVVKDIRSEGLDQPSAPMVYMPFLPWGTPRYVVRADTAPTTLVSLLKSRARTRDSAIALRHFETLRQVLDDTVRNRVLAGILVGGFALLGLFISSVGLYGTLAAQVQHRSREIGVRIALGATVRDIVGGVMADGIRILAAGTAAGLAVSAAAASLVSPHLYGVHALDPASFAFAVTLLSAAALAACLIPALKAARLDPIRTLNVQ